MANNFLDLSGVLKRKWKNFLLWVHAMVILSVGNDLHDQMIMMMIEKIKRPFLSVLHDCVTLLGT